MTRSIIMLALLCSVALAVPAQTPPPGPVDQQEGVQALPGVVRPESPLPRIDTSTRPPGSLPDLYLRPPEVEIVGLIGKGPTGPRATDVARADGHPDMVPGYPYTVELRVRNNGATPARVSPAYVLKGATQPQPGTLSLRQRLSGQPAGVLIPGGQTRTITMALNYADLQGREAEEVLRNGTVTATVFLARSQPEGNTMDEWLYQDSDLDNHVRTVSLLVGRPFVGNLTGAASVNVTVSAPACDSPTIQARLNTTGWRSGSVMYTLRRGSTTYTDSEGCRTRRANGGTQFDCPVPLGRLAASGADLLGAIHDPDTEVTVEFAARDSRSGLTSTFSYNYPLSATTPVSACQREAPPPPDPIADYSWHEVSCVCWEDVVVPADSDGPEDNIATVDLRVCMDRHRSELQRSGDADWACAITQPHIERQTRLRTSCRAIGLRDTGETPCDRNTIVPLWDTLEILNPAGDD